MMWFRRIYVHIDSIVIVWLHVSWVTFLHLQGKLDELKRADAHPNNLGHPFARVSAKHSREIWHWTFLLDFCFKKNHPEVLDLRIRAVYPVQGGILADKIGYGKTARFRGEKMGSNKKDGRKPSPDFFLLFLLCWPIWYLFSLFI